MGAWGVGHFENDDAMDFVSDLVDEEGGWKELGEAFAQAGEEYLEAPDAMQILAAAELVAAGFGVGASELPDEAAAWLKGKKAPPAAMKKTAKRAVERVAGAESELAELWEDAKPADARAWKKVVKALIDRLS